MCASPDSATGHETAKEKDHAKDFDCRPLSGVDIALYGGGGRRCVQPGGDGAGRGMDGSVGAREPGSARGRDGGVQLGSPSGKHLPDGVGSGVLPAPPGPALAVSSGAMKNDSQLGTVCVTGGAGFIGSHIADA